MTEPFLFSVDDALTLLATGRCHTGGEQRTGDDRDLRQQDPDDRDHVGQLAHGLQCAHELALTFPDDLELQVAGLVHDIGHDLVPGDDAGHGRAAADAVRTLFGERVADLVELHVPAKRYLVTVEVGYADILSGGSTSTLVNQGGPMTPREAAAFAALPLAAHAVALRIADDAAKVPGRVVPERGSWRPVLETVATRHGRP